MKLGSRHVLLAAAAVLLIGVAKAEDAARVCPRPSEGAVVIEPPAVQSKNGELDLRLSFKSVRDADGAPRYCYVSSEGMESPTLRVSPGDRLSIHFQNDLAVPTATVSMPSATNRAAGDDAACNGAMSEASTNLHFHGLVAPPVCHQDESIHTLIDAGQSFHYDLRIPASNSPGLYWYHPHPHGFSAAQVQGGASGALIVEGIDAMLPALAALPHRTFILRDQLLSPAQAKSTGPLTPSWDVSINYVPIRYPQYVPATIQMQAGKRQFWRFVNAAANTIFNLQILYDEVPQQVQVVAIDGTPVGDSSMNQSEVYLPPGARVEFIVAGPHKGQVARLVTQKIDSGPAGDNAPARPLANLVVDRSEKTKRTATPYAENRELTGSLTGPVEPAKASPIRPVSLTDLKPVRTRSLYFSQNGNGTEGGSGAATKFFLTVVGQPVKSFDMDAPPNIIAQQGTVEDWNVQNYTPEDHIFHIHEVHFQVIAVNGVPVDDPVIRDTIRIPHQQGRTPISTLRLRIDFRDPAIVGDFVYHCHILDHEDKGMMGKIRVLPAESAAAEVQSRMGVAGKL